MADFIYSVVSNYIGDMLLFVTAAVIGILWVKYKKKVAKITGGLMTGSPNGARAAFESDGEIWITGRKGLQNLSNNPAEDTSPIWSMDSRWVAFSSKRNDGDWNVYVGSVETLKLAQLTSAEGYEKPMGWSMQGHLLISVGGVIVTIPRDEIAGKLGEL